MPRLLYLAFVLMLAVFSPASYAASKGIDYIIDTDIGGDIDDVLTLLVALNEDSKPLAITTTHIDPLLKAKLAKLILTQTGFQDIPVYAGIGNSRNESREAFMAQNPLWPASFGYPRGEGNEKTWFAQQGVPYRERFGAELDSMLIESEPAPAFIAHLANHYSKEHPLTIVAIGPLHNIASALALSPEIAEKIRIYSMGGVYPKGYNWLVAPQITAPVLSSSESISIISQLIDRYQFYIKPEEFQAIEANTHSPLGLAILSDWRNWYHVEANQAPKTHLSDLVTLYLALHPDRIKQAQAKDLSFPCLDDTGALKSEFEGLWYNMPGLENQIMVVSDVAQSNSAFVEEVRTHEAIRNQLLQSIRHFLEGGSSSHTS